MSGHKYYRRGEASHDHYLRRFGVGDFKRDDENRKRSRHKMYGSDRYRACYEDRQRVRDEDYSHHKRKPRWSEDFSGKVNYEVSKFMEEEIRSEKSSSIAHLNIKAAQTKVFSSTAAVISVSGSEINARQIISQPLNTQTRGDASSSRIPGGNISSRKGVLNENFSLLNNSLVVSTFSKRIIPNNDRAFLESLDDHSVCLGTANGLWNALCNQTILHERHDRLLSLNKMLNDELNVLRESVPLLREELVNTKDALRKTEEEHQQTFSCLDDEKKKRAEIEKKLQELTSVKKSDCASMKYNRKQEVDCSVEKGIAHRLVMSELSGTEENKGKQICHYGLDETFKTLERSIQNILDEAYVEEFLHRLKLRKKPNILSNGPEAQKHLMF